MGLKTQRKVPVGIEVPNATQGTSATVPTRQVVPQTANANGETQICHDPDKAGSASLSNETVIQSTVAQDPSIPKGMYSINGTHQSGMVGKGNRNLQKDTYACNDLPPNKHVKRRLGCSVTQSRHRTKAHTNGHENRDTFTEN